MNDQLLTMEQMQHLKELGIDVSKASSSYDIHKLTNNVELLWGYDEDSNDVMFKTVPVFTLQDVIDLLPKQICPNVTYNLFIDYQEMRVAYCFHNKYGMSWIEPTFSFFISAINNGNV